MRDKALTQAVVDGLQPKAARYKVYDGGSRSSVPGLAVRVSPGGHKAFMLAYRFRGKARTATLGNTAALTLPKARALARSILAQAREAEYGRADDPAKPKSGADDGTPTVADYVTGPYARTAEGKKSGPATLKRLQASFGQTKVWRMRLDDPALAVAVVEFREARLRSGVTHATVNRDVTAIRAVLSHAVDALDLDAHPLRKVRPLKETQEHRVRYLTPSEEARLWAALDRREERIRAERASANAWRAERGYAEMVDLRAAPFADFLKPLVTLAIHTGMRRGELFSLEWADIDLDARVLTVRGAAAKSGKARRIPLNTAVLDMLNAWGGMAGHTGIVFPSPKTGGRLDNVRKSWAAVMADAEIEGFRFHDLRHHFASCLVMDGVPLNTVRELLGHAKLEMTLRYAHLAPEAGHDAVARLALRHQRHQNVTAFPGVKENGGG